MFLSPWLRDRKPRSVHPRTRPTRRPGTRARSAARLSVERLEGRALPSLLGPGSIDLVPTSPTSVTNTIPFGNNTDFGFTGFIYRNVPAFTLVPGQKFAFDLGALNDVDVRRNIYFAVANRNPAPPVLDIFRTSVISQGVRALGWTQVVSDNQIPLNPRGNLVSGDYELTYTAEAPFTFPGGGLIVG